MNATVGTNLCDYASLTRPASSYILVIITSLILSFSSIYLLRTTTSGKLYHLGGLPVITAWKFFSKRYDFMRDNIRLTGGSPFRFRVLHHRVTAVSGPIARKGFFNNPSLDLSEGYRMLMGGTPNIEDIRDVDNLNTNEFIKRIQILLRKERITEVLPLFLEDANRLMSEWGAEGIANPFEDIADLIFQITVRNVTCAELAQDRPMVKRMAKLYWTLEKSATPTSVLLPWLPIPARRMNKKSKSGLYNLILNYVQEKRKVGATSETDAIDIFIRNGDSDDDIIRMVMGTVFAGFITTGINTCWTLLYVGTNPEWRQRAISELQSVISAHNKGLETEPFHKQLAAIPLSSWENNLKSLDLIIKETIRLSATGTVLRRNLKNDVEVQGVHIQKGDFMAYCLGDVHMDEDIYTSPGTFDPGRFEDGQQEDRKTYFGYLGWGAGRHPCAGMRIAKLEIKLILALMLIGYDYEVVDGNGNKTLEIPRPNANDIHQARPLGKPVYLKFRRMKE